MSWKPSIRLSWQYDFEDRYEAEDYGVLLGEPDTLFDFRLDQEARDFFTELAFSCSKEGSNPDPGLEDRFLRKAAQRGDPEAIYNLMVQRYELEHDSEALRWSLRLLSGKYNQNYSPDTDPLDIQSQFEMAQQISDWSVENQVSATHGVQRLDSGSSIQLPDLADSFLEHASFCLKCGKLKFPNCSDFQCDDSVHMVLHSHG